MNDDDAPPLTEEPEGGFSAKAVAIAVTPKVTGGISILCSSYLISYIVSDQRRRSLTYQRLVALLCCCDLASSLGICLSTWPLPQGNNFGALYEGDPDGSNALCTAQGVLIHWGITTALANVVLSTHYLLVVKYRFTETKMKTLEPYYIAAILTLGLICISIPLSMNLYGYNPYSRNIWCFIFVPPDDCEDEADCIRLTVLLRWVLFFGPLWFCILLCMILMITLYCIVRRIEAAAVRWRSTSLTANLAGPTQWPSSASSPRAMQQQRQWHPKDFRQTKKVARQALLYGISFIVVWLPLLVLNTFNLVRKTWFDPEQANGFVVLWTVMFFQPLQGLFNLIIYQRFGVVRAVTSSARRISSYVSSRVSSKSHYERNGNTYGGSSCDIHQAAAMVRPQLTMTDDCGSSFIQFIHHSAAEESRSAVEEGDTTMSKPRHDHTGRAEADSPTCSDTKSEDDSQAYFKQTETNAALLDSADHSSGCERNIRFASRELIHGDVNDEGKDIHAEERRASQPSKSVRMSATVPISRNPSSSSLDDMDRNLETIYGF
jgi:hypothetical protein